MNKIVFYEKNNMFSVTIPRNGFTINETNQEYSDQLFANWSYPFDVFLSNELIRIYGDPSKVNIISKKRKDWGFISVEGSIYPACLKFVSCQNKKLKLQIEYGYESLEVFEKKLNELDLEVIPLGFDSLTPPALSVFKKFPEVNINYPCVEVKRMNDETKKYETKGYHNRYEGGEGFIANYDAENDIWYGMKPFVYLFHILQKGFEMENLILAGDILNDRELKYALLNHSNIPFEKRDFVSQKKVSVNLKPDPDKFYSGKKYQVTKEITLTDTMFGNYVFSVLEDGYNIKDFYAEVTWIDNVGNNHIVSMNLSETQTPGRIDIQKTIPNFQYNYTVVLKLRVTKEYEGLGNDVQSDFTVFMIPQGTNPGYSFQWKTLDIRAVDFVPDITFGALVNAIKKSRKYKVVISGNKFYFMKTAVNFNKAKNLEFSETDDKEVLPNGREAYIMKLTAPEEYKFTKYKINTKEILTEFEDSDNDDTETIEIEGYPLPIANIGEVTDNIRTAVELVEENSTACFLRYEGLQGGKNLCLSMESFLIPYIFGNYYHHWVQNRLAAVPIRWKFYTDNFLIRDLTSLDLVYCYQSYAGILESTKKFIGDSAYELELKIENRY